MWVLQAVVQKTRSHTTSIDETVERERVRKNKREKNDMEKIRFNEKKTAY
jgi:hypothetical protein